MKKIFVAVLVVIFGAYGWYTWSLRAVDVSDMTAHSVTIPSGLSVRGIGSLLEEKGILRSARAFAFYVRIHRLQSELQAGDFLLQPSMSGPEVALALQKGYSNEVRVTIPEGFTVKDIDDLLAKKSLIAPGDFIACAQTCTLEGYDFLPSQGNLAKRGGRVEGYLFPDTYSVYSRQFVVEDFIKRLLETFRRRVIDGLAQDMTASKRSLKDVVTMASLIEEETRTNDERPVVAGILWKRFDGKMGLGVDATVRYILEKPTSALTANDLAVDSAYNLRKFRGLPPGPIANPGLQSIEAALKPQASAYLYYLHGTDGKIRYAETNDEHNRNKALYLK